MVNVGSMTQVMKERLIKYPKKGAVTNVEKKVDGSSKSIGRGNGSGPKATLKRGLDGSDKKSSHKKSKVQTAKGSAANLSVHDSGSEGTQTDADGSEEEDTSDNIETEGGNSVEDADGSAFGEDVGGDRSLLVVHENSSHVNDMFERSDPMVTNEEEEMHVAHPHNPFLSVDRKEREAIRSMTKPEGREGWSILDLRTHDGFTGEDGVKPMDCLKAFDIPVDQMRYGAMDDREFFTQFRVYNAEAMSRNVYAERKMHDMIRRVEKAEKELERIKGDGLEERYKEAESARVGAEKARCVLEAKYKESEDVQRQLATDLENERTKVNSVEDEKKQLEKDLKSLRGDFDARGREIDRLKKLSKAKFKEHVRVFLHTQGCNDYINHRASDTLELGYKCCMQFVGNGKVVDFEEHDPLIFSKWSEDNEEKFKAMEAVKSAPPDPVPTADPRYEIHKDELVEMERSVLDDAFVNGTPDRSKVRP